MKVKGSELKKLIIFMSQKFSYLDEKKYFSISIGAKNNDEMIRARIVISFLFLSKLFPTSLLPKTENIKT